MVKTAFQYKGPFRDPQPHDPNFFSKKVEIFICTSAEAFRYNCSCAKYFLQIHLLGEIIGKIVCLLCRHYKYQHSSLCNRTIQ